MLEDPQEKEKVSTKALQSLVIVYEWNQEKNPSLNKKNEKKKHKEDEWPRSYIPKASFLATLEANTPSPFTKKSAHMNEMMELFKQVQSICPFYMPSSRFHPMLNFSKISARKSAG